LLADNDIDRGFVVGVAKDGHRHREGDAQLSISGPTAVIVGYSSGPRRRRLCWHPENSVPAVISVSSTHSPP